MLNNPFAPQQSNLGSPTKTGQPQQPVKPPPSEPPPFMAVDKDKYGLPYYGEGFKGFARKVFAKIFDPGKIMSNPTREQAELMEESADRGEGLLEKAGWNEWVTKWTGITAEEAAQSAAALKQSMTGDDGEFSAGKTAATGAGVLYRASGQAVSAGLEALGAVDKLARKGHAFSQALDQIGDTSTVLPDLTDAPSALKRVLGDKPIADKLGGVLNLLGDMTPIVAIYDLFRAASSGQSMYQKVQTVKSNLRASNMVYTMYWDEAKKTEYMRRVQSGENPDLLMAELEHPWVELGGSFFGDPTTYMGMGIIGKFGKASTPIKMFGKTVFKLPWETVAKIPTFSELLGIKSFGKLKLLSAGDDITKIADQRVDNALRQLEKVNDDKQAVGVLREAVNAARQSVRQFAGYFDDKVTGQTARNALNATYGIFSPDAAGRAEIHKKTVGTVFNALVSRFRNTDDIIETFKAYRNLSSSNDQVATKAFMHLKEVYGELPFSQLGMQSMEFMARLIEDVNPAELLAKHKNNIPEFIKSVKGGMDTIIEEMYPTVDDMEKAFNEAKKLGNAANPRQQTLAKAYSDLKKYKPSVIWTNNINRKLSENKLYKGLNTFYSNTLMGMRPAYATRNLVQNSFVIWHDLGFRAGFEALKTGAEVLVKSTAGRVLKQDWAADVIAREANKIKDILGYIPTEVMKGVGAAEKGGFGFLGVGQDIEKVHSAIIARYAVETEMDKFLRYSLQDTQSLLGNLPKEVSQTLLAHATRNFGDVAKTMADFRASQATGFFETWRHLELDPAFKDTLRRSNLLDELEDIRRTAPDAVTFTQQFDAFIKKVEDLASRTADEPALVSDTNPIAEVVATVEKAFEEGGRKMMSEEELNQFRALVELRGQLRLKFQEHIDIMKNRVSRFMTIETYKPFEQRFAQLNEVLEQGNSKWRNYASEVYDGIYTQSRKGTPPVELWNKAQTVMLDIKDGTPVLKKVSLSDAFPGVDPASLSNEEFNGMLWKWFKTNQDSFWTSYTQEFLTGQERILTEMAQTAGVDIAQLMAEEYGSLNNPKLQKISELTKQIEDWQTYLKPEDLSKYGKDFKGKTLKDMTAITSEFPNWRGGKTRLFNAVNADRAKRGENIYASIDEVPFEEAVSALKKRAKPMPPYVEGTMPTVTRQLHENLKGGFRKALDDFKNGTLTRWGEKLPLETTLDDAGEEVLSKFVKELDRRSIAARAAASRVADETRNFILHDYNKTYADGFAKYFMMYHYWGSRTYAKWMERGLDSPKWVNLFYNYRETMGKIHSDQPEFYRYNAQIPAKALFGLNDSPIFFNLEATLNPLYGLTGVDFNDPKRRVDWMSSAIDDMGKIGFNTSMPIQWAMAFHLYRKGEDEAARRWLGRLIPATTDLKAALNLLKEETGVDLMPDIGVLPGAKYGDFDPFINAQGGFDAYEEKRVSRALAAMVDEGLITKEQALDLMRSREGEMFDEAVYRAINERAPGQLSSFFFGQGFKARSEADMKVDEFYSQYYKLLSVRENMSPEQYRNAIDTLRTNPEYQFADVVLLSARGGDERDTMYAYNVLGRIPPGDSSAILRDMGLSDELVQKFYDEKGDFTDWLPQDKERFMSAIVDLGATFAIPDQATRLEWNAAKDSYKDMQEEVSKILGYPYEGDQRGVWDIVSTYYDLKDTNVDKANEFKRQHPEIDMALSMATEAKLGDPLLAEYYVSLDTIETYYFGKTRAILAEQFGADITDKQTIYFEKKLESAQAAKQYLRENPELIQYWKAKKVLDAQANDKILEIASGLPMPAEGANLREDFTPENAMQEQLTQYSGSQVPTWEEVTDRMAEPLVQQIVNNYESGMPISDAAMRQLDYLAGQKGYYNGDDLLRQALYVLQLEDAMAQGGNPFAP